MTVVFTSELGMALGYVIGCCPSSVKIAPRYGDYQGACSALDTLNALVAAGVVARTVLPGCELPQVCPGYDLHVEVIEDLERPEVQVASDRAPLLLDALGYGTFTASDEMFGVEKPETFRGRVLTALAVAPQDAGMPGYGDDSPRPHWIQGGRHVQCARQEGWLQDRLARLHELADWCERHGRQVQWH